MALSTAEVKLFCLEFEEIARKAQEPRLAILEAKVKELEKAVAHLRKHQGLPF